MWESTSTRASMEQCDIGSGTIITQKFGETILRSWLDTGLLGLMERWTG